jgi:hypothetical protein
MTRESIIEKKVCNYAITQGWVTFKWTSPSSRFVPDRLYFKDGKVKIVEFKAPRCKPTKAQRIVHGMLNNHGFTVHIIDNIDEGKLLFTEKDKGEKDMTCSHGGKL